MQLTNKEILEKAITKAIDGGLTGYWADRYKRCQELDEMEYLTAGNLYEEGHSPEELIFNHGFAKALWGEEKYMAYFAGYNEWSDATDIEYVEDQDYDEEPHEKKPIWQYHLQQMVISENPIQYLGEHLDG